MALLADVITPYDPLINAFDKMHMPPSGEFWLGSDQFGRDIFTRIVYGARTALFVGFVTAGVGAGAGLVLGVASAYFGGVFDLVLQRIMDVFMAFPLVILAPAVVSNSWPRHLKRHDCYHNPVHSTGARVVRSSALAIREIPYVDAARALGFSHSRIILRHMGPNVVAPFLILATAFVGLTILLEASPGYLGLGVQEPTPAWGLMPRRRRGIRRKCTLDCDFPGIAISLAVFGFNLFGMPCATFLIQKLCDR